MDTHTQVKVFQYVDSLCSCVEEDYESRLCSEAFEHNYCYEYEYDSKGNILEV